MGRSAAIAIAPVVPRGARRRALPASVDNGFRDQSHSVAACLDAALRQVPDLEGAIELEWTGVGWYEVVRLPPSAERTEVARCLEQVAVGTSPRSWTLVLVQIP